MLKDEFFKDIEIKNRSKATMYMLTKALEDCETDICKHLETAEWEDIRKHISNLQNAKEKVKGKEDEFVKKYSDSTISLKKTKLKQFFSYCYDETDDKKYKKMIKELSCKIVSDKKLRPEDILLDVDIQRMVNVATMERDRLVLKTLFEGGLRVGELLALTWDMVKIDHERQEVTLNIPDIEGCKTGDRVVMCTDIYHYVIDWQKCSTSPKFIDISFQGLNDKLKSIAKKAVVTKPVNAHAFRHAAITHEVLRGKLDEFQLKMRFWGTLNTNMLAVYVHLSEEMKQDVYRNSKGKGDKEISVVINKVCVNCGRPVIEDNDLCNFCESNKKKFEEQEQEIHNNKKDIEDLLQEIQKMKEFNTEFQKFMKNKYEGK